MKRLKNVFIGNFFKNFQKFVIFRNEVLYWPNVIWSQNRRLDSFLIFEEWKDGVQLQLYDRVTGLTDSGNQLLSGPLHGRSLVVETASRP